MSVGILGKKLGMSQLFDDKGNSVPVTLIEAGPCRITQLKTTALDGYAAVQIGYGLSKDKHISKPEKGHLLKSGEELLKHLKEYRVEETSSYEIGNQITVKNFEVGQKVDISGKSMGRGFAGYQKRHGFSRGPMSHGSKNHRAPGSTGAGTTPGRIYPGKRMAGRYGGKQITTKGLLVLKIDDQKNLLVVKGSVPGKPGSIINIKPNKNFITSTLSSKSLSLASVGRSIFLCIFQSTSFNTSVASAISANMYSLFHLTSSSLSFLTFPTFRPLLLKNISVKIVCKSYISANLSIDFISYTQI